MGIFEDDRFSAGTFAVARAGRIWTEANALAQQSSETNGQAHDGYAVWTTGRPGGCLLYTSPSPRD